MIIMVKKKINYLNSKEKKVVKSFVKDLREKLGDDIVSIRLFGSKVRGDFKEDSDIDIFIAERTAQKMIAKAENK